MASSTSCSSSGDDAFGREAVENFRQYLRIKTVQPTPDYGGAVVFLEKMAKQLQLDYEVFECVPKKPVFVMTWKGKNPELPSILLNSHIDVVPVFPEKWQHDPFGAVMDEKNNIYARGSQDMKCVGIQYLEAVRKLKSKGVEFSRTIHVSFVPDEEIGGHDGMEAFINGGHLKKLNVGFALDEGLASAKEHFMVYYGERASWWIEVTCPGNPGHGSMFIENNAGEKLRRVIESFLTLRDKEEARMKANNLTLGDVTTVNLTVIEGGLQLNVIPAEFKAKFDMRITPTVDLKELEAKILSWCKAAGEGVSVRFLQKNSVQATTSTSADDPWWSAFSRAIKDLNLQTEVTIFPAATDSRYLRALGYPAIGFSPMNNTPVLLHDHNEYLNCDVFLRGIDIYVRIIEGLANVPRA